MKINQIIVKESMGGVTAGAVASVAKPLGEVQKRTSVSGLEPAEKVMKGKAKKKGPYANSLSEGKVKELDYDMKTMKAAEFKKKYGKTREEVLASFKQQPQQKSQQVPVKEADLHEEDKIIAVGKGNKLKPGLLSKPENSVNPTDTVKLDVPFLIRLLEFAREDANSDMDLHDLAEKLVDRGRRGKTLTMKDYEYVVDEAVQPGGVIAGGGVGESVAEGSDELYGLRVGDTVKAVINGKRVQGDVIDIFPDSMEVELLLRGINSGKTVTVDVRDTEALNEQGESEKSPYDFLKVGKWVKFGMWNKPQEHKTGRIMKIGDGVVTVVIDGGPLSGKMVDLNLGNKSLSIKPATEPNRGLASVRNEGVAEGAKVDRMVQHIKKSEIKSGKSADKAEDIAWATVNKRGYLDNANKKKKAK